MLMLMLILIERRSLHLRNVREGSRPLADPHHRQLSPDTAEEERLSCFLMPCNSSTRENQQLKDVNEPGKGGKPTVLINSDCSVFTLLLL